MTDADRRRGNNRRPTDSDARASARASTKRKNRRITDADVRAAHVITSVKHNKD